MLQQPQKNILDLAKLWPSSIAALGILAEWAMQNKVDADEFLSFAFENLYLKTDNATVFFDSLLLISLMLQYDAIDIINGIRLYAINVSEKDADILANSILKHNDNYWFIDNNKVISAFNGLPNLNQSFRKLKIDDDKLSVNEHKSNSQELDSLCKIIETDKLILTKQYSTTKFDDGGRSGMIDTLYEELNKIDCIILTALEEEKDAVLKYMDAPIKDNDDNQWSGTIGDYNVKTILINNTGNISAGIVASSALNYWNPSCIFLVGITGAVPNVDESLLGDVIVADMIVNYEKGKVKPERFEHRYDVFRPDFSLLDSAKKLDPKNWCLSIETSRPDGSTGRIIPKVHFGTILSGEKVVTCSEFVRDLGTDWPEMLGIEMEAVGVAMAVYLNEKRPKFLIAKGISDWANPIKDDAWHKYAAESSAVFISAILREPNLFLPKSKFHANQKNNRVATPQKNRKIGEIKIEVCRKMIEVSGVWEEIADYLEIPMHQIAQFKKGREPYNIWEFLESTNRLHELSLALEFIGRSDIAYLMKVLQL